MSDLKISGLRSGQELLPGRTGQAGSAGQGFEDVMKDAIGKMSQIQNDAEMAVKDLASGSDVTQAIIAMEKADMSFQLMIEVRNKLLSAYEEIQRMQI